MRCLECEAENAEATEVCARCGASAAYQRSDLAAAEVVGGAARWAAAEAILASAGQQPSEPAQDSEIDGTILAEWVEATKFSVVRLRRGYDIDQVDAFLGAIRNTFFGIREPSLTPNEIRNKQFSTTFLRPGYHEEEIDVFLDEAELKLAAQVGARNGACAEGQQFVTSEAATGALPPGDPIASPTGDAPHQPTHQRPQSAYSWRDALVLVGLGPASARGPGGVTVAERHHRWQAITCSLLAAFTVLPLLGLGLSLSLPPGQHVMAAAAFLAGIAVAIWGCVWGCARGWRMGARFDDHGVTVCNFLRAYRFSWPEVRRFADGLIQETGQNGSSYFWAMQVVLNDGRAVTAKGTARKKGARPQTLAAIRQAAARHSVPAALTGIAMKGGSPVNPGLYPDPGGQPGL